MSPLGIGSRATKAAALRERLGHPVVDADGHYIETGPALKEFVREYARAEGGGDLAERFERVGGIDYDETVLRPWSRLSDVERRATWATRPPWWSLPAANTLDRATAHLPRLLAERLGDLGPTSPCSTRAERSRRQRSATPRCVRSLAGR